LSPRPIDILVRLSPYELQDGKAVAFQQRVDTIEVRELS
jgi:hypothetical protein